MTTHNWGHDLGRVITSLLVVGWHRADWFHRVPGVPREAIPGQMTS